MSILRTGKSVARSTSSQSRTLRTPFSKSLLNMAGSDVDGAIFHSVYVATMNPLRYK